MIEFYRQGVLGVCKVSNLIYLIIGFAIGTTTTFYLLQRVQYRRIIRLENLIHSYLDSQYNYSRHDNSKVLIPEKSVKLSEEVTTEKVYSKSDNTEIKDFLKSKSIKVKSVPLEQEADEVLSGIALLMGNRYSLIKKFYERIKSNMNPGRSFSMNLRNEPQETVSNICQLGTRLHRMAFLEEYRYQKSPKFILSARPSRNPKALNFFSGKWLEQFIKAQVIELIQSSNSQIRYSYLLNPQIVLPNGDNFELDILFKIEEDFFWFEAKTGDYQRYIEKYSRMSSLLELGLENSFMVLTGISKNSAKDLSLLYGITIIGVEQFREHMGGSLSSYLS